VSSERVGSRKGEDRGGERNSLPPAEKRKGFPFSSKKRGEGIRRPIVEQRREFLRRGGEKEPFFTRGEPPDIKVGKKGKNSGEGGQEGLTQ